MQRPLIVALASVLALPVVLAAPAAARQVQPQILISATVDNAAQLDALFDDTVKWQGYTITLSNNIDMSAYPQTSAIGNINRPFTSTFDGNGKKITNLSVEITSAGLVDAGMFGALGSGHLVKDLTLNGVVTGVSTAASAYAGGLAGSASNGEIRNVVFVGEVTGQSSGNFSTSVGGLVGDLRDDTVTQAVVGEGSFVTGRGGQPKVGGLIGYAERPILTRSASVATVHALDNTDISRDPMAAGLVGSVFGRSTIRDTYHRGAVGSALGTGQSFATFLGGLLGDTSGSTPNSAVDRSYAFSTLTASGSWQNRVLGGLIGGDVGFNTSRSFYDDTFAAVGFNGGGSNTFDDTALDDTQQIQFASYAGVLPIVPTWEVSTDDTVWGICDGQGYPYLLWQVYGDPCLLTNTVSGSPQVGQVLTANADTAAVNDVLGYQWGWYDGGVFTRIMETPFSTYTVRSADIGHQMAVRVTSTAGTVLATEISTPTAVVTSPPVPPPARTPGAPTSLTATPGDASITMAWTAPADSGSFPVSTYQVQASPGGATCLVATTSCELAGLSNGTTYSVQVRALNGAGWGAWSAPVDVTPEKPVEPAITITASQRGRIVSVNGTATGLPPGTALTSWVSMGTADFAPIPRPVLVKADGTFTWERKRNPRKQVRVYFSAYDRGVIESNTVTFASRR